MPRIFRAPRFPFALGLVALLGLALAACGSTAPEATTADRSPDPVATGVTAPAATTGALPAYDFPTGPAVTVPVGYEPPSDRVDTTGAHLPANGKPTLVFVDAIW
ncbi:MAG: hypothetical protein WEB13_10980 [Dehalococcoidia bacterium]